MRASVSVTALRLAASFGAVLALFAGALGLFASALDEIASAEAEVQAIGLVEDAGHHVSAMVREQYIHQAHTVLHWDESHVGHYEDVVRRLDAALAELERVSRNDAERGRARDVAGLVATIDRRFREGILSAIARDDRPEAHRIHDATEALVGHAVERIDALGDEHHRLAAEARDRETEVRTRVTRDAEVAFGLATVLAAVVVTLLLRSLGRRVQDLSTGAARIARGELDTRLDEGGRDELARLAGAFNRMASDLADREGRLVRSQRLAAIGQVAAGVAHEVNNPLTVILGHARLLLRSGRAGASEPEIATIEREAVLCQRIVQGLLDLARPAPRELSEVDLDEALHEAVEHLRDAGRLDGVAIEAPAPEGRVVARADAALVRQVLANVIQNAVEASPPGGAVTTACSVRGAEAVVAIADSGGGMTGEVRERALEPFFTTKPSGTGLGLAICQALMESQGGVLAIDSAPGEGTRVELRFPVAAGGRA